MPRGHKYAQFYCCYLLRSSKKTRSFYIGSTPLPLRRLRQHNGELLQGAWKTKQSEKRPWEIICIVSGFPSKISALQFEHAWQHPFRSRHIQPCDRITKNKTQVSSLHKHLGNLRLLLSSPSLNRWPLKFHIFDAEVHKVWKQNKYKVAEIPSHVAILLDLRTPEGLNKDTKTVADRRARELATDSDPCQSAPKAPGRKKKAQQTSESSQAEVTAELELLQRTNVHEGDGLGGIKGLKITNDMYEPYFSYSAHRIESGDVCGICSEDLGNEQGLSTVICSNTDCLETYHTTCLAKEFLSQTFDPSASNIHVLPVQGSCTTCEQLLDWGLLIRNSHWRVGATDTSGDLSLSQQHQMVQDNDNVVSDTELSELSDTGSNNGLPSSKLKNSPTRTSKKSHPASEAVLPGGVFKTTSRERIKETATGQSSKLRRAKNRENASAHTKGIQKPRTKVAKEQDPGPKGLSLIRGMGSGRLLDYIPDSEDESDEFEIQQVHSDDQRSPKLTQQAANYPLYSSIEVVDVSDQSTV
ncbi:hypothetical protein V1509DRAFT_632331 [Lipomyces kononenkoae]